MIRVGQRLKEERLKRNLSLEDASSATKIRVSFLSAIEKGEYDRLPTGSYTQGFVQNYADFLGLPKREITALFRREYNEEKNFTVLPEGLLQKKDFPIRSIRLQKTLLFIICIFIGLAGYLLFQYRYAFLSPPLDIHSPKEGSKATSKTITVIGTTDPSVTLSINNQPTTLSSSGEFRKQINLFPGKATIHVKAINRFGKETIVERHIVIEE